MSATTDLKPSIERLERDLLDRPARRLLNTGLTLLAIGVLASLWLGQLPESQFDDVERWDAFSATAMVLGGFAAVVAVAIRVIQRGRREEIRVELFRALGPIEVERARRDMRLMDMADDLIDRLTREDLRVGGAVAEMREEMRASMQTIQSLISQMATRDEVWQEDVAEAYRLGQQNPRNGPPPPTV